MSSGFGEKVTWPVVVPWWVVDSGVYGADWGTTIWMWVGGFIFLAGFLLAAWLRAHGDEDAGVVILIAAFAAFTWPAIAVLGSVFGVLNLLWRVLVGAMKP